MPRVAPIVRSTRYEHAINTLVAKRAEISGAILFIGADLAHQLEHIDAVLLILGYKGDPAQIIPLRRTPNRFRKDELYRLIVKFEAEGSKANKETAQRIVQGEGLGTVACRADQTVRQHREGPAAAEGKTAVASRARSIGRDERLDINHLFRSTPHDSGKVSRAHRYMNVVLWYPVTQCKFVMGDFVVIQSVTMGAAKFNREQCLYCEQFRQLLRLKRVKGIVFPGQSIEEV
ncbi:hypothetical protein [Mesorhizobium amorphae]|uniref:hypothetical protein n=1 Tax=Mesorhizobium amorphae TaxID=71433 RepID=UPI00178047CF|nr:hypothetical protein [Mesorhizobium amorphae]